MRKRKDRGTSCYSESSRLRSRSRRVPEAARRVAEARAAMSRHLELVEALRFLWEDYASAYPWWEPVLMMKRLFLIGFISQVCEPGTTVQLTVAFLTCLVFLALHLLLSTNAALQLHVGSTR